LKKNHKISATLTFAFVLKIGLISLIFNRLCGEACFLLNKEDEAELEYALRGKDWAVYWLLLKNGLFMSIRKVQKALHFSSPSWARGLCFGFVIKCNGAVA
jgi:hypothetical protein